MTYSITNHRSGKYEGERADLPAALQRARELSQRGGMIAVYDDDEADDLPPVAFVFAGCVYTRVDESK